MAILYRGWAAGTLFRIVVWQNRRMRYRFGEHEVDDKLRVLIRRGAIVALGQRGLDLLVYLIRNRSRVVSKDELRAVVWDGRAIAESTIPTAINVVRRAIEDSGATPSKIESVYGKGYRWMPAVAEAASLDEGLERDSTIRGFVGRSTELRDLEQLLDLDPGETGVAFIIGEAGFGKTRLLEELAFRVRRRGGAVASSNCPEAAGAPPFYPWKQVFREIGLEEVWDAAVSAFRSSETDSREQSDAVQFTFFDSMARGLEAVAAHRPLFVLIDDLHCADESSLLLFDALARTLRPRGVRILGSFRPDEFAARRESIASRVLGTYPAAAVTVPRFTEEEAEDFLRLANIKLSVESQRWIVDHAEGVPFVLDQYLRQVASASKSPEVALLPPGIEALVETRISRVGSEGNKVLQAASVVGREFSLGLLRRVLNMPEVEVLRSLEEATSAGIILRETRRLRFRFGHVLLRDALYRRIAPADRARLHERVVEGLREIHGGLYGAVACEAAVHGLASAADERKPEWLSMFDEAARWSSLNLGFEEAARYLEDALEFVDRSEGGDRTTRADLLLRLGSALRRAGRLNDAATRCRQAAELAREIGDPQLIARASLSYAPGFFALEVGVVDDFLIAMLEEARDLVGPREPELQSRISAQLSMALYWSDRSDEGREIAEEAVSLALRSAQPGAQTFALCAREAASWGPDRAAERADLTHAAIGFAEAENDREMELVYRLFRLTSLLQLGEFEEVSRDVAVFGQKVAESVQGSAVWYRSLFGAVRAMMNGDWEVARELCEEFVALGERVQDRNAVNCGVTHAVFREMEAGEISTALEIVEEHRKRFPRIRSYACSLAYLFAAARDSDKARQNLVRFVSRERVNLCRNAEWLIGVALLAEAASILNDRERARTLFEELRPFEDEYVVLVFAAGVWRPVSYFLARLAMTTGQLEESERLFEKAQAQAQAAEAPPWLAHAKLGQAELLRKRAWPGDGLKARKLALSAEEMGKDLGMRPLLARAHEFLWGNRTTA